MLDETASPRQWVQAAYVNGASLRYLEDVLGRQARNMESTGLTELDEYVGTSAKLKVVKAMLVIGYPDRHEDMKHASHQDADTH